MDTDGSPSAVDQPSSRLDEQLERTHATGSSSLELPVEREQVDEMAREVQGGERVELDDSDTVATQAR